MQQTITKNTTKSINDIKVTVVIACHNHGNMIKECLESVQTQTYPFKSAVIVNDGSTDNSLEIIKSLIKIEEENRDIIIGTFGNLSVMILNNDKPMGPSAARNKAIKTTFEITDIFAILDADDRFLPNKLSYCVEMMKTDLTHIGIVYNDVLINDSRSGKTILELREPFNRLRLEQEDIIPSASIINKKALQAVGLYDEEMRTCEDWDLWLRITGQFIAIHIPEPLHIYTVTGFNSSFTVDKAVWNKNWNRIRQKLSGQLTNNE
jgi:glycosyltransferase involved in cell wall biosynthesis